MKRARHASGQRSAPTRWNHLRKILVPTDFSKRTARALPYALDLARQQGAEVHLLHVIPPLEGDAYSPLRYSPEAAVLHQRPDKLIYDLLASTAETHDTEGVHVELVKQRGMTVAGTILDYAQRQAVDLIVIGTHGVTGVRHFFLGSVAEEVVHRACCHVLIVHERDDAEPLPSDVRRVLVPVDFSPSSPDLLRQARHLAAAYNAEIDLLHVVESPSFLAPFAGLATLHDLVPDLHEQAQARLERLLEEAGGPDVPARAHLTEGRPAAAILDFARQHGADLIVIATRGLSGVKHFFLGSVTERVVRAAPCPVLSVNTAGVPAAGAPQRAALEAEQPG